MTDANRAGLLAARGMNIVLVACALMLTVIVARREFRSVPARAEALNTVPAPHFVANASSYGVGGHLLGVTTAPVRIVEFSDFQCPVCARAAEQLQRLQTNYPGRLSVVYRHFPLNNVHPYAAEAAVASECAAKQRAFPAYHAVLFQHQANIGVTTWTSFAVAAKVRDTLAFNRCLADPRTLLALSADAQAARRLDLRGTPSFVVGDTLYEGLPSLGQLESWFARTK